MKERRKNKTKQLKEKKTALTSTWKNLPLEATKNSKKLKKEKTIQEKKKEKKAQKVSLSTTSIMNGQLLRQKSVKYSSVMKT